MPLQELQSQLLTAGYELTAECKVLTVDEFVDEESSDLNKLP
jgi:hypothetical protein